MRHKKIIWSSGLFLLMWTIGPLFFLAKSQVWGLPCGSSLGGSYAFLTTATTTGEGVYTPLDYLNSTMGSNYFVMYEADRPLTVIKGKSFDLRLIAKSGGPESQTAVIPDLRTTCAFIYSDWNRDGLFEDVALIGTAAGAIAPQGNMAVLNIKQTIIVPADAKSGKTRLRVRYTNAKSGNLEVGAMHDITKGLLFDIAVYVVDAPVTEDYDVVVKSSSIRSGKAEIVTASKENGRFDKDTKVQLLATTLDPEQNFISWTVGGEVVSTDPTYEFSVSQSMMVVANFSSPLPELALSAPQVSTEEEPIWFQIMNAQTDNRKDLCISNDGGVFKCLKPADGSIQYLWRMEATMGNKVKFISKKDGRSMIASGSNVQLSSSAAAEFVVAPSGNANGSYSVKFNNDGTQLLNCDGASNALLLYNGGVGTGSGWYFYKAIFAPPVGVSENGAGKSVAYIKDRVMTIRGGKVNSQVRIFDMAGKCVQTFRIEDSNDSFEFDYPQGCYLIELPLAEGGRQTFKSVNL